MTIIESMKAHQAKPQAEKDADLQALLAELAGIREVEKTMPRRAFKDRFVKPHMDYRHRPSSQIG